jgi:hypothetical protein
MAWAVAVERVQGSGFAFYAMNLAADNQAFLAHNAAKGFSVYQPPVMFHADVTKQEYRVEDQAGGLICVLRHQPRGSIPLPFFPVSTEVWTPSAVGLARRLLKWRGVARVHLHASVASTLTAHPFFGGANLARAEPLPHTVFSSLPIAPCAAQRFTRPRHVFDTTAPASLSG